MAEQMEPVRRRVALKIIKPGMDTKNVIARFEAERQALALMDHPSIAKVFDAGATDSGRPYFVMELVRGIKITEYCDQNSLTTEERLNLFVQVCRAVQHAHQKGIIHRDIKPSNILVTQTLENEPLPVVIDFGIAKATTNQQLTDKTHFTAFEMLIGTPAYMSPEQAALTSVDVDTRTDIYSLGVLLYELLTGSTPFDATKLLKAGLDEIRRVIRDEEPIRPSTRLGKMTVTDLTTVAQHRRSEPPRLVRSVRGDLDWIVMKALEKDRTRRYETANGLALDVQRFLANETISARPPSKIYKFQKTVLRNKLLFSAICAIAILLVVSLALVTASLGRERKALQEAKTETARSQQTTRFLQDMLQGVGPSVALGQDTAMLKGILDKTADRVGKEMADQPAIEAELRSMIGGLYLEIGNYDKAEAMHRAALALNKNLFGPASKETATALNDLGLVFWKQRKLTEAETAHKESLAIRRQLFGNEHPDVAASLSNLGNVYRRQRRLTDAEALTREALAIRQKLFGHEHLEVAESLRNLSIILGDEGKKTEAETTAREMLEMRRRLLGNDHPLVAAALADVAWAASATGKLDEAQSAGEDGLAIQRKLLGDAHPEVAKSLTFLGQLVARRGDMADSHALLQAAVSIQRKVLGDDSLDLLYTLRSFAWTLEAEGKWADAESAHREVLKLWRKRLASDDPEVVLGAESLVRTLLAQKKFGEAEQQLNEVLTPDLVRQPTSLNLLVQRADLMGRRGRWREAADAAALVVEHQPTEHYRYHTLAPLMVMSRNHPAYESLCQKMVTMFSDTINPYVAERVAQGCLLLPNSGVDLQSVDKLADCAVIRGIAEGGLPYFQVCKAMSNYRLGRFAEAIEWGAKPLETSEVNAQAKACAVLAMAHWQLGHTDKARAMLARGEILAPPISLTRDDEEIGGAWVAWLSARISLDEAKALIQPVSPKDDNASRP